MSYRKFQEGDDEHEAFEKDGEYYTLDGLAGLHVDDFLGCGEGVKWKCDVVGQGKIKKVYNYKTRVQALGEEFTFGSWSFAAEHETQAMTYCGAEVWQDMRNHDVYISHETYLHKVKPITISKERRATPQEECNPKEVHQLRAGIGELAWPAHQTSPFVLDAGECWTSPSREPVGVQQDTVVRQEQRGREAEDVRIDGSNYERRSTWCLYFDAAWAVRPIMVIRKVAT